MKSTNSLMAVSLAIITFTLLSACSDPSSSRPESGSTVVNTNMTDSHQKISEKKITPTLQYNPRKNINNLSQRYAEYRSSIISNVYYKLDFVLTGEERFSAISEVEFELADNSHPLTLDLNKGKIESIEVNGELVDVEYNQWFITLPSESLINGNNTVKVTFSRLHSTNGEGLHRFVDTTDQRVYLYSHFEPSAASQMFALFDQPDLKATFTLSASVPKDWSVISATRETGIVDLGDSNQWNFPESPILSPYNFSMHAGPYKVWSDKSGKYPMRLFARHSIVEKIDPNIWFTYTKQGLAFFDEYFAVAYPFKKYDQVLVPDFLYGAMENAAAITFAERSFTSSSAMTLSQKERLAGVIMHEMAHQWFGDLVTMKWWNGLWLNESFASFMGTLALAESTEFDYAWRSFYARSKQYAYVQDQRVTTHPIEVPVPTSANAFDNIDAITYSKGASVLMQLRHLLGKDEFQKGVQNYLKKYSYKNAELDDFINSLADAAGRDLTEWKQQWLFSPSVNTLTAKVECDNGLMTQLILQQTADATYPTLREQKVQLGLFNINNEKLALTKKIALIYSGEKTEVKEAIGEKCPDLIYPNYQDWGFVRVNLDEKSFETVKSQLANVDDLLLRSMLWQSLWDSVREGKLPLNEYLEIAISNLSRETDYTILRQATGNIEKGLKYLVSMDDIGYSYYKKYQKKLDTLAWEKATDQDLESNFQKHWFLTYIDNAADQFGLIKLYKTLNATYDMTEVKMDQDYRWQIIKQLNRYKFPTSEEFFKKELKKDGGDSGQKRAISAEVIQPDEKIKQKWLKEIFNSNSKYTFPKIRQAMGSLFPPEQNELLEKYADQLLEQLVKLDKTRDIPFMRSYTRALIPATCTKKSVERLARVIEQQQDLSNLTHKALLVAHQEDNRCLLIKKALAID